MSDSINEDEPNIVEEGVEVEEDVEEKDKDIEEGVEEGADKDVEEGAEEGEDVEDEDVEGDPVKLPLSLEDVDVPFYPGEIQEDADEDKIPVLDEGEEDEEEVEEEEVEEEEVEEEEGLDKVVQDYSHKMLEFNTDFNMGDLFLIIFFDEKK